MALGSMCPASLVCAFPLPLPPWASPPPHSCAGFCSRSCQTARCCCPSWPLVRLPMSSYHHLCPADPTLRGAAPPPRNMLFPSTSKSQAFKSSIAQKFIPLGRHALDRQLCARMAKEASLMTRAVCCDSQHKIWRRVQKKPPLPLSYVAMLTTCIQTYIQSYFFRIALSPASSMKSGNSEIMLD